MENIAASTVPFLQTLADLRVDALTKLVNVLTFLGDEKLFVVISLIVLWCFSKRGGLYMLTVGFGASSIGQTLKILFHVPRPWNLPGGFDAADPVARNGWTGDGIVAKVMGKLGDGASGWSFPSGHTLISVGTYGAMAAWFKSRWVKFAGILLAVLIPFTRLYLGVHTPVDIIGGALTALVLVLALRPVFTSNGSGKVRTVLICSAVLTAVLLGAAYLIRPADMTETDDIRSYLSGIKDLWQLVGATIAVWVAFEVDDCWLHYDTKAVWWAQILKVIGGCVVVLGLMMGIQKVLGYVSPRDFTLAELTVENATRMGCIACLSDLAALIAGAALWPATFRWFGRLGRRD